jgi:selenocysteine lyase/cysteine desulfurase
VLLQIAPHLIEPGRDTGKFRMPFAVHRDQLREPEAETFAAIAIEMQQVINRARIAARQRELAMYLRSRLGELPGVKLVTPTHAALWAAIQSLQVPNRDHGQIVDGMAAEDRVIVGRVRHGAEFDAIRVSLHAYNDTTDVDRFVNALRRRL